MLDHAAARAWIQPVILTVPGRERDCATPIVRALAGQPGFCPAIVFEDRDSRGAAESTRQAITRAGESGGHVLFLEDDLVMDEEAPARIAATTFPDGVGIISFCDMREVPEFSRAGVYRFGAMGCDGRGWWGNQALLIHGDIVRMAARVDWFAPEVEEAIGIRVHKLTYGDAGRNCSDIRLSLLVELHGKERSQYAVSVPSVFLHVGDKSMCFPGRGIGERETRNWIGDRRRFGIDATLDGQQFVAAAGDPATPAVIGR
ncbi:MAG: hypothetical protein ACOYO9_04600 [Candidatus Nanopelagicales bacterium]